MGSRRSTNLLAPGFRFHPTDEELVRYYLRRKIYGKPLRYDAISDIDIYKVEPWDLPGMSRLKTGDLEWYFFSVLDKKYGNGARTNRATERGYWKTTGKDRSVNHKSLLVGRKKTLVYHSGRAPKGQRTNWVMHEYRMIDKELDKAGIPQDAFVLCRIFQKSGAGPKNGEQYGAPFVEEEWEDDELQMDPRYAAAAAVDFEGDELYLDVDDIDQILGDIDVDGAPISMNSHDGENGSSEVTNNSFEVAQKWMQHPDEQKPVDLAVQQNVDANLVRNELIGGSSEGVNCIDLDYLLNDPLLNSTDDLQFDDGAFLEANDLANPIEVDNSSFDVEEFLTFFDANSDFQYTGFDPSVLIGNEDHIFEQAPLAEKNADEATQQLTAPGEHLDDLMPSDKVEPTKSGSGFQYPFMKQASQMLGNIPAPPALASEFPTKDAALRLNSVAQSSSSVHVTAGLIEISNLTAGVNGTDWLLGKHGEYNIILSFGLSRGSDNSASLESVFPGKTSSIISRGWFYYMFFSVLLLAMSFNIGTLICAR